MKKAMVITVGSPKESLGAMKLSRWLSRNGYEVNERTELAWFDRGYDLYCFSCVFSWKLPKLVSMVRSAKHWGEVWIGGPAVSFWPPNAAYVEQETGVPPHIGIDDRFETEPGAYAMVYFSRGCPAFTPACGNCPVPRLEGTRFRFYPDATPAGMLLDNNLSELPAEYQEHIIRKYSGWEGRVDANSGFEPHSFTEKTLLRWKGFPLLTWRFGYDDITERDESIEMMRLLQRYGYKNNQVTVYTMIGNEPIDTCVQRIREVIEHGFYPWPQRVRPLGWLGPDGTLPTLHDWDEPTLIAYQRFYSRAALWRNKDCRPEDFWYQGRFPLRKEAQT